MKRKEKEEKETKAQQKKDEAERKKQERTRKKEAEKNEEMRLQELKQMNKFDINSQWNTIKQKHGINEIQQ